MGVGTLIIIVVGVTVVLGLVIGLSKAFYDMGYSLGVEDGKKQFSDAESTEQS